VFHYELIAKRHGYGIFDALMIASALRANCGTLWSENMQDVDGHRRPPAHRQPAPCRELSVAKRRPKAPRARPDHTAADPQPRRRGDRIEVIE
jgi:hypothetical protein